MKKITLDRVVKSAALGRRGTTAWLAVAAAMVGLAPIPGRSGGPDPLDKTNVLFCAVGPKHLAGESFVRPGVLLEGEYATRLSLTEKEKTKLASIDEQVDSNFSRRRASDGVWMGGDYDYITRGLRDFRSKVAEAMQPEHLASAKALLVRTYGLWVISFDDLPRLLQMEEDQIKAVQQIRELALFRINALLPEPARPGGSMPCRVVNAADPKMRSILEECDRATLAVLSKEQAVVLERIKSVTVHARKSHETDLLCDGIDIS